MINVKDFFTNKDVVAVALSGGKDSMALLHVLYNNLPKGNVKAINVEHGIRGEESLVDTEFVKAECKKLGVELLCFSADCPTLAKQNAMSLEEVARKVRYEFFKQAVDSGFCNLVATAHHLSDSVETILFNMFRGSGGGGVTGIDSRGYIIRPFADITRQEIDLYVDKNGISFVEDSTNLDENYTRNYIRNAIIPKIKQRFPEMEKAISRFSKIASSQDEYILQQAKRELTVSSGEISFKQDLPKAVKYKCVMLALNIFGLTKDYEYRHCQEVDKLSSRKNGDVIDFPLGIKCVKDYGKITFFKDKRAEKNQVDFNLGEIEFLSKKIIVSQKTNPNFLRFDLDKLPSGCVVRTRQQGDQFTPFGGNKKSLKKYLIDKKIPCRKRDDLILIAKDNMVYIIVGVEIADSIKQQQDSKNIYYIGLKD